MIITHASGQKIEEVKVSLYASTVLKGCLFFGDEGNTYCLDPNGANFQYNLNVDSSNIIRVSQFFYEHTHEDPIVNSVLDDLRIDLGLDGYSNEQMSEILDESNFDYEEELTVMDAGDARWLIQQYQGILAHKLGYECAESTDEQGAVYIVYCAGRELQEIEI